MPFTRRRSSNQALRPVNRIKHVVDAQGATAVAGNFEIPLIDTVDALVLANTAEVETASTVNAIYLKVEAYATSSAALSNFYMMVFKNPGNNLTFPNPNVIGSSDQKKWVIHQEMTMLQKEPTADSLGGNPRVIFNGVIVIPRGYRRNGPDDSLRIKFLTPGVSSDLCLQCHYKEFR